MGNKLIVFLGKLINRFFSFHTSFMLREKRFDPELLQICYAAYPERDLAFAIVMQGPVISLNSFTYETLKLYRHVYPNITIILSTWKDENTEELEKIRRLDGIAIIENSKPAFAGIGNINMQITSTTPGIMRARDLKATYILKTRTDIRLCKSIDFLYFLLYRSHQFATDKMQLLKQRLVVFNVNMFKVRLYTISDLTMFGHVDDMINYWNVPIDDMMKADTFSFEELYKSRLGEFYYTDLFFKKMNFSPIATTEAYNEALVKFFAVTDLEEVDLFWYKYRYYMEGRSRYNNLDTFSATNITWTYGKWLTLFKNDN